nr:hypothetical protein [Tanacetum cinerariifolium]
MGQLSQSKRKDIEHELEVARVTKRMKTMDSDDNKQKLLFPDLQKKLLNEKKKKEKFKTENERLSIKRDKTLADLGTWQDQISRHEGEVEFASLFKEVISENERLSIERDKTLADLGTWQNQISRHEGEVEFASLFKKVICTELEDAQKLLADIQSKNLNTKDMQAELENNKFGTSQIEQLNCVRDCLLALAEGRNEVISNEPKSIDELAQASKHGKDKAKKGDY